MKTILDDIIANKIAELNLKKQVVPASQFEKMALFERKTVSITSSIKNGSGIIAEFKRRSPSKPAININARVQNVTLGYQEAGASAISVLTDNKFFGGSLDDILLARACVNIPLLRKDFIIEEYQILEAKANGADVILLIAAALRKQELKNLSKFAQSLGLEVLLEVHNEEELEKSLLPSVNLLGVNNRNLKTFETNINTSKELSKRIPSEFVRVSESGISSPNTIKELKAYGYEGFLIGEQLMKTNSPYNDTKTFIDAIN
jgi:indole-3-glycerol phosphate synthase